jgi:hypothetical protein
VTTNPLTVRLPNGQTMKSTDTAILDITELSKSAKAAHIFPATENKSLLAVVQLCDEGYSVLFSIDEVTILNATQKIIMKGSRDLTTGLWRINVCQNKPSCNMAPKEAQIHSVNIFYSLRNIGALVNYIHKAMFSFTCQKRSFGHVARINRRGHQQALEINTSNCNGPHEPKKTKHPFNQRKST